MNWTIVVFTSRTDTMNFFRAIKNYGLYCSVVNTPRSLSSSCGVSVKIDIRLASIAPKIINQLHLSTFKGIFNIQYLNGKEITKRLL